VPHASTRSGYLPPQVAETGDGRAKPRLQLADRQGEVVALLAKGHSNKDIVRRLGVMPATVKTHVEQVLLTLGATNRIDAAIKARELGLI
jgi:DNA-binding NarL/FixJ family response regulator